MNYYKELTKMNISTALCQIAELMLPRGTRDKVLTVSLVFDVQDFRDDGKAMDRIRIEPTFIFYRPNNYMFVGLTHDNSMRLNEESKIEYLSCHDSCWRDDGVRHHISLIAQSISNKCEGKEGLSVFTSFGLLGARVLDGHIKTSSSDRAAIFIKPEIKS